MNLPTTDQFVNLQLITLRFYGEMMMKFFVTGRNTMSLNRAIDTTCEIAQLISMRRLAGPKKLGYLSWPEIVDGMQALADKVREDLEWASWDRTIEGSTIGNAVLLWYLKQPLDRQKRIARRGLAGMEWLKQRPEPRDLKGLDLRKSYIAILRKNRRSPVNLEKRRTNRKYLAEKRARQSQSSHAEADDLTKTDHAKTDGPVKEKRRKGTA